MTGRSEPRDGAEERFDALAKAVADGVSRRQAVKLATGLAMAGLMPRWSFHAGTASASAYAPAQKKTTGYCSEQPQQACTGQTASWTPQCTKPVANGNRSMFNGCGPQGGIDIKVSRGDYIPDEPLGLANFFGACKGHDCCYGQCGSSKEKCDDHFLSEMVKACHARWPTKTVTEEVLNATALAYCLSVAVIYYDAVSSTDTGQNAFNSGQEEVCDCCEDCQTVAQQQKRRDARWWRACPNPDEPGKYMCLSVCRDESNCGACGNQCPDAINGWSAKCQDGQCVGYPGALDYCSDCGDVGGYNCVD
jgi:hypothetical protein